MEIIVPIRQVPDVALNIRVNEGKVVEDGATERADKGWEPRRGRTDRRMEK